MAREPVLRRRIKALTSFFIFGLFLSGLTAIPLEREIDWLAGASGARPLVESRGKSAPGWAFSLMKVQSALSDVRVAHPFLFYGTDWLAFGHFVIAIAFVGALRDPVRNRWLFDFGLIACALVVPYAIAFGALRGIPLWWRLVDCSFGVGGFVPLWFCRKWSLELEMNSLAASGK